MNRWRRRLAVACTIVAILVALPAATWALEGRAEFDGKTQAQDGNSSEEIFRQGLEEDLVEGLFERMTRTPQPSGLPDGFAQEVLDPGQLGNVRIYTGPGVVGLVWEDSRTDMAAWLARELDAGSWLRVGATEAGWSYVKEGGSYRWLNVQLESAGGWVSAVFNYETTEGG